MTLSARVARRVPPCAGAAALSIALLLAPAHSPAAQAYDFCRSDPAVVLSDGATVDLSADIADSLADVRDVSYILHIPAGTRVLAWVGTDGLMGLRESFQARADAAPGAYASVTTVTTATPHIAVTAHTQVVDARATTLGAAPEWDRQPLQVQVQAPS
jgi:fermentation-respiration switch protein FrsA (DUF1100 family)